MAMEAQRRLTTNSDIKSEGDPEQSLEEDRGTASNDGSNDATAKPPSQDHVHDDKKEGDGDDDGLKENGLDTYFPDPDIDNPTLIETIAWWAESTSIHGLHYALERGHFERWKLYLWTVIVATCTVSLISLLTDMISEYRNYKLNTASETIVPSSMDFPQVTVCNTNVFQSSLQQSTGIRSPTNEKELLDISQPLEDFIVYTAFNGITVSNESFSDIWTSTITFAGECFTFDNTDRRVLKPGPGSGLVGILSQLLYPLANEKNLDSINCWCRSLLQFLC
jgi:Amiloride-sensitive sodium channel